MSMFSEFHFLRPLWLLALLALPLLLWWWQRRRSEQEPWRAACDPHLLVHLLQQGQGVVQRWPQRLFALGFVLAVLALAGPAFRQLPQALSRAESALVVALDLSDRMRATDLKPDRIARARYKLADLLRSRREGQTALIAYAGDAFMVAPLTDDAASLSDLLASLTPETLPVRGQRADRAIRIAQRLLRDAGFERGDLLLVTDRVESRDAEAAQLAASRGLRVSVLGVGTEAGAPVPLPQGGFLQGEDGKVVLPQLDEAVLRDLAAAGEGRYARLGNDAADLATLDLARANTSDDAWRADERTRSDYRDEGPWLVLLLLPLAALAFRRGWLAGLPLLLVLPASDASAFDWSSLWRRDDQRAYQALQQGLAQEALALAGTDADPALRGSAAYQAEDYAQAEASFARGRDADAHYNRGNALAKAQRFEEALKAYDQALNLAPDMEDAQANRQAVQDWLKQQQQQQQQQGEQGDSQSQDPPQDGAKSPSDASSQSESQQGQAESSSGQQESDQNAEPQPAADQAQQEQAQQQFSEQMEQALQQGENGEQAAQGEAMDPREAEKQQAVEQWLRRVPDDPGGLLRRKFALEYQRRRREGQEE